MNIAGYIMIITFSFDPHFVELSTQSDIPKRSCSRSRSPQPIEEKPSLRQFTSNQPSTSQLNQTTAEYISRSWPVTGIPGGNVILPQHEQICIAGGIIFLQMPGDLIRKGTLNMKSYEHGVPSWLSVNNSHRKVNSPASVFMYIWLTRDYFLQARLKGEFRTKKDPDDRGYKCFVKAVDGCLFAADLVTLPVNEELYWPRRAAIYVRVPETKSVYAGVLKPLARQNAPIWMN